LAGYITFDFQGLSSPSNISFDVKSDQNCSKYSDANFNGKTLSDTTLVSGAISVDWPSLGNCSHSNTYVNVNFYVLNPNTNSEDHVAQYHYLCPKPCGSMQKPGGISTACESQEEIYNVTWIDNNYSNTFQWQVAGWDTNTSNGTSTWNATLHLKQIDPFPQK
jgi:hypothetical protein